MASSIIDQKREVHSQLSTLRTSCEGFPDLNLSDSFGSMCNGTNSLSFLMDLLKSTIGYERLIDVTSDMFTFELPKIEDNVKKSLKQSLKKMINCGIDPSIPDNIKHQNVVPSSSGIDVNLKDIDYMGIMLMNPSSKTGSLTYKDKNSGLNSTDFNTYLYETVQLDGTQTNWGSQVLGPSQDVLSLEFNSVDTVNNTLNIKVSEEYSKPSNNKKLTDLNNDYIDSLNLFDTEIVLNNIMDSLFGTISLESNKTLEQIKKEVEVDEIINCILNVDGDIVIDDSFFEFDNESIRNQEEKSTNRANGIRVLKNCGNVETNVSIDTLTGATSKIVNSTTQLEKSEAVSSAIGDIGEESSKNVSPKNKTTATLDFVNGVIEMLMSKLGSIMLGPKVMTIFSINHEIIHGTKIEDPLSWMKQNTGIIKDVLNTIRDSIISKLMELVIKEIKNIVKCVATKEITERVMYQKAQLVSLLGIPPDIIRQIMGLGSSIVNSPITQELTSSQKITGFGCKTGNCDE